MSAMTPPVSGEASAASIAASSRNSQMQTAIVPAPSPDGKNAAALSSPCGPYASITSRR